GVTGSNPVPPTSQIKGLWSATPPEALPGIISPGPPAPPPSPVHDSAAHRHRAQAREAGKLTPNVEDWLAWAHAKSDRTAPLIAMSDVILDAAEPKRPGYW